MNKKKDATAYYEKGEAAFGETKFDQAILYYTRTSKLNKDCLESHFERGRTLGEQGNYKKANKVYRRVLRMDPKCKLAYYNNGFVLDMLGKSDESIQMYQQVIELDPRYVDGYYNLAIVLTTKGKYEEAEEHYMKVLELKPSDAPQVANCMGYSYFLRGAFPNAITEFQKALNLDENYSIVSLNMSLVLYCESQFEEALRSYEEGIKTLGNKSDPMETLKEYIENYTAEKNRIKKKLDELVETSNNEEDEVKALLNKLVASLAHILELLIQCLNKF